MKRHIPNAFTLANLTVGCLGIWLVLEERIDMAIYLLLLSVLLDFLDGFMARLLNVKSEIGKQLDSMADMVSFGVFCFRRDTAGSGAFDQQRLSMA